MNREDVASILVGHMLRTKLEDLPEEAVAATKKDLLDTLGVILAGSTADGIGVVRELVCDWAGKRQATTIAYGDRVPAVNAALLNGSMAHARDYDDAHSAAAVHAGVSIVPACLAIAETKGKVSGKEFLTAMAAGIDIMCRLGMACGMSPQASGWHNTGIFGVFGSTASCGRLLGLDETKMLNALGIAYSQCSGNIQCIHDGALSKRLQAGLTARAAVLSALLAEKGYTGAHAIFEGKAGLFNVYYKGFDKAALTADLGGRFEVSNLSFKPYPCCRTTHPGIDAVLTIAKEHPFKAAELEKIVVYHGKNSYTCLEPLETKVRPRTVVDAQFSVPYTVARAIVQGKVGLSDFTPEAISDEEVLSIAQKVETHLKPEFTTMDSYEPMGVELHLTGGRVYSSVVETPLGEPQNPMTWAALAAKFRDCASHSVSPVPAEKVEKVIGLVDRLETARDVTKLVHLVS